MLGAGIREIPYNSLATKRIPKYNILTINSLCLSTPAGCPIPIQDMYAKSIFGL
jgi:hypothetical protein